MHHMRKHLHCLDCLVLIVSQFIRIVRDFIVFVGKWQMANYDSFAHSFKPHVMNSMDSSIFFTWKSDLHTDAGIMT